MIQMTLCKLCEDIFQGVVSYSRRNIGELGMDTLYKQIPVMYLVTEWLRVID